MSAITRILIIEDELAIAEALQLALGKAGYPTDTVAYGARGLELALAAQPAYGLVLMDVGLPDLSGLEVCRRLRGHFSAQELPVLFLTAHNEEIDRVLGLEIGGGDYMAKPFSLRELVTRVRLLLQRTRFAPEPDRAIRPMPEAKIQSWDHYTWDTTQAWVAWQGRRVELTLTEFRMMVLMLSHPQRVFSRQQLLDALRGEAHPSGERTIDTHIKTLRAKLRAVSPDADQISTRRGLGYALGGDS